MKRADVICISRSAQVNDDGCCWESSTDRLTSLMHVANTKHVRTSLTGRDVHDSVELSMRPDFSPSHQE